VTHRAFQIIEQYLIVHDIIGEAKY